MASSRITVLACDVYNDDWRKEGARTGSIHQFLSETQPSVWFEYGQRIDLANWYIRVAILLRLSFPRSDLVT